MTPSYQSSLYRAICFSLTGHTELAPWKELSKQDWEAVVKVSKLEKVAPLLYYVLRQSRWPVEMPSTVRNGLRSEYYNAAGSSLLYFEELERLLRAFARAKIPAIMLKGAALAQTLYPDFALRPLGDLDLLIRSDDVGRAVEVVQSLAYVPENPPMRRGLETLFFYETNFKKSGPITIHVELHWNLLGAEGSRYAANMDWFWQQCRPLAVGGTQGFVLSHTAQLLHSAVHSTLKHGGDAFRLLWLLDLHLLVTKSGEIDWSELHQQAREFHWEPALVEALILTQTAFNTILPLTTTYSDTNDTETQSLLDQVAAPGRTRTSGAWTHTRFLRGRAKLQWIAAVLAPDPEYMRWRYEPRPTWLWPLCYLVRWADIAGDVVSTLKKPHRQSDDILV